MKLVFSVSPRRHHFGASPGSVRSTRYFTTPSARGGVQDTATQREDGACALTSAGGSGGGAVIVSTTGEGLLANPLSPTATTR